MTTLPTQEERGEAPVQDRVAVEEAAQASAQASRPHPAASGGPVPALQRQLAPSSPGGRHVVVHRPPHRKRGTRALSLPALQRGHSWLPSGALEGGPGFASPRCYLAAVTAARMAHLKISSRSRGAGRASHPGAQPRHPSRPRRRHANAAQPTAERPRDGGSALSALGWLPHLHHISTTSPPHLHHISTTSTSTSTSTSASASTSPPHLHHYIYISGGLPHSRLRAPRAHRVPRLPPPARLLDDGGLRLLQHLPRDAGSAHAVHVQCTCSARAVHV